jgi:hypothetical protein
MLYFNLLLASIVGLQCSLVFGQLAPGTEATEPSPEMLDAAFTTEDAAREAAAWSDVVINRRNPDPVGKMAATADLVFRGQVKSQEYVYDDNDVPYTHTTFTISEILQGTHADTQITVIQEGGPSRTDEDSVVFTSNSRYFNVGEEELLFVSLEPEHTAPTRRVSIEHRFRIYGGKLYDDNGRGLLMLPAAEGSGHRLGLTPDRDPAQRFSQIHIGPHTITKVFDEQEHHPDSGGDGSAQAGRTSRPRQGIVDVETFTAAIRD